MMGMESSTTLHQDNAFHKTRYPSVANTAGVKDEDRRLGKNLAKKIRFRAKICASLRD